MTEQELIKQFKQLRRAASLSKEEQEKGLVLFLQKVDEKFANQEIKQPEAINTPARERFGLFKRAADTLDVLARAWSGPGELARQVVRVYSSHLVASVLITVLAFGAFGSYSGISARKALPDDKPLYTLKRALEKTQLTLSFSSTHRAELRVSLVDRRLEELDKLMEKTIANPEQNGEVVVNAIKNAQDEIKAVKEDLVAIAKNSGVEEVASFKDLIESRVPAYRIALSDAHEDLPPEIKEEIEPEVAALTFAISEINDVIELIVSEEIVKGDSVEGENPFDLDLSDETTLFESSPTTTPITSTEVLIFDDSEVIIGEVLAKDQNGLSVPVLAPAPVEEEIPFKIRDTHPVGLE